MRQEPFGRPWAADDSQKFAGRHEGDFEPPIPGFSAAIVRTTLFTDTRWAACRPHGPTSSAWIAAGRMIVRRRPRLASLERSLPDGKNPAADCARIYACS